MFAAISFWLQKVLVRLGIRRWEIVDDSGEAFPTEEGCWGWIYYIQPVGPYMVSDLTYALPLGPPLLFFCYVVRGEIAFRKQIANEEARKRILIHLRREVAMNGQVIDPLPH